MPSLHANLIKLHISSILYEYEDKTFNIVIISFKDLKSWKFSACYIQISILCTFIFYYKQK